MHTDTANRMKSDLVDFNYSNQSIQHQLVTFSFSCDFFFFDKWWEIFAPTNMHPWGLETLFDLFEAIPVSYDSTY